MQYETICDHICDDIASVLLGMKPATPTAAYAAARATRDVAAAFHHAAGDPVNPRWRDAIGSLERFLAYSTRSPGVKNLPSLHELAAFVDENADLLAPEREYGKTGEQQGNNRVREPQRGASLSTGIVLATRHVPETRTCGRLPRISPRYGG